jgi:ferricrocin synthase
LLVAPLTLPQTVASHGALYSHYFKLVFNEAPDLDRLEDSWLQVVNQTSILRTSFHFSNEYGSWMQAVHTHVPSLFSRVTVPVRLEDSISAFLSEWKFDTELALEEPPVRVRVFELTSGDVIQVLRIHHALYDGISIGLLFHRVQQIYLGNPFAPSMNFQDALPILLSSERKGGQFWKDYLRGFQATIFSNRGSFDPFVIDKTLSVLRTSIDSACRDVGVTFQSFGQAALWKILSQLFRSSDITFGHVISGRNLLDDVDVIGPILVS